MTITAANETQEQVNAALEAHGYDPAPADVTQPAAAPADETVTPPPSTDGTTAPASEPDQPLEQSQPGETPQAKAARTRKAVQERIDELTRLRYTETGKREQAEAELARLRQQIADTAAGRPAEAQPATEESSEPAAPVKPVHPGKMPRQADFDDYDQFAPALDAWEANNQKYQDDNVEYARQMAVQDFVTRQAEADAKAEMDSRQAEWDEKLTAAQAEIPDWAETMAAIDISKPSGQISAAMADAVRESDAGPKILHWLAKHPAEAAQIFETTYVDLKAKNAGHYIPTANRNAARAVARIEAQLAGTPAAPAAQPRAAAAAAGAPLNGHVPPAAAPAPRQATQAPNPIRPLRGGANSPAPDATKVIGQNGYTASDFERDFPSRRRR